MSKKVSELQKKQIKDLFIQGNSIQEISKSFQFSQQTITRQLKIIFGEIDFKKLKKKISFSSQTKKTIGGTNFRKTDSFSEEENKKDIDTYSANESFFVQSFCEVPPLLDELPEKQKDLSSVSISEIKLPDLVYMIVDKKIELEIKLLKDYPEWSFLPIDDLNRKTISIFFDLKIAKRFCNKEQKVIKVPNTDVFRIVAPILRSRGISRIVSSEKLIAL